MRIFLDFTAAMPRKDYGEVPLVVRKELPNENLLKKNELRVALLGWPAAVPTERALIWRGALLNLIERNVGRKDFVEILAIIIGHQLTRSEIPSKICWDGLERGQRFGK